MFSFIGNKKGITMLEVMVSVGILTVGILSLLTLLPSAWRLAGLADYLGRASGILASQLQTQQAMIQNPAATIAAGTTAAQVYPSGQGTGVRKQGDVPFTVQTTLTDLGGGNAWLVSVRVTWTGNATGISESLRVVRQENYRQ
jgi:Tfp pilus assembly protein PilV